MLHDLSTQRRKKRNMAMNVTRSVKGRDVGCRGALPAGSRSHVTSSSWGRARV